MKRSPEPKVHIAMRAPIVAMLVLLLVGGLDPIASSTTPSEPGGAILLYDIDRIVSVESQQGWLIDRIEIDDALPQSLQSACRATPTHRRDALALARARYAEVGGDVGGALDAAGGEPGEIKETLAAHRAVLLLERTLAAVEDDCPLWIRPSPKFLGRQTDRAGTSLYLEGGGLFTIRLTDEEARYGGGGSGRFLLGHRFGEMTWMIGGEWGGAGLIDPSQPEDQVRVHMFAAAPVVMRLHGILWHVGLELAPVWSLPISRDPARLGGRAALQLGYTGLRRGAWLPGLGFAVAYEASPAHDDLSMEHIIRAGFRGSFSWDPNHGP